MITLNANAEIAEHVMEHGGATVSLLGGRPRIMGARDGDVYLVGGAEDRHGNSIPELHIPVDKFTDSTVEDSIDYVMEHRRGMDDRYTAVGYWVEPGTDLVVIDAVDAIMGYHYAMDVARSRGERAIYRLSTGATYETGL